MVRRLVQFHTVIMACGFAVLALSPSRFFASLDIADTSYGALSLTRVIAVLLVVVAAAVLSVPSLTGAARVRALTTIGLAYAVGALLLLTQEIAIWSTTGGAIITAVAGLFALAFVGAGLAERRPKIASV